MVEEMVEWFFENYEDPVHNLPYDSGEGGYQYFNGGPYEAEDALYQQFGNASQRDIEEAVQKINSCGGPNWVKISDYSSIEDYEEDNSGNCDDELVSEESDSPF